MQDDTCVANLTEPQVKFVGFKFQNLALLADIGVVPTALCLTSRAISIAFTPIMRNEISRIMDRLRYNKGYDLAKASIEIRTIIKDLSVPTPLLPGILQAAREVTADWKYPLIVRSSSAHEDCEASSGAGVNVSVPNIRDEDSMLAAVLECWKGYFALPAIAHRLRSRQFDLDPLPALIIQRYIADAVLSGVACSRHPMIDLDGVFIEYSHDGPSGVESGTGHTNSFFAASDSLFSTSDLPHELASTLINVTSRARKRMGNHLEIEWCFDGIQLYLIQVRPIVISMDKEVSAEPRLRAGCYDLYRDVATLNSFDLGDVEGIYEHSITERRPIRLFAAEHRILTNGTAVVIGDCPGLDAHETLNQVGSDYLVIDAGPYLRSLIVPRAELTKTISHLIGGRRYPVPFIVREFICGEYAAVTVPGDEGIMVEVCRGSLVGLNRGFVPADVYIVANDTNDIKARATYRPDLFLGFDESTRSIKLMNADSIIPPVSNNNLLAMAEFTRSVNERFGLNSLEWSIVSGRPIYIDNTPLNASIDAGGVGEVRFISGRQLSGTIVKIRDPGKLQEKSISPTLVLNDDVDNAETNTEIEHLLNLAKHHPGMVVVATRPFTALSPLVGRVGGFICDQGPILCHLAIIARESGTPIAIVSDASVRYRAGDYIELKVPLC